MTFGKLWTIAYRDLLRNRRRSILTLLAVALGLALLIVINGLIAGMLDDALQNNIRLRTAHLQLRAASYEERKVSLLWQDLLENPTSLVARMNVMAEVETATPVLWANSILSTGDESVNLQLIGIDPTAEFYAPVREGVVAGDFIAPDDREGIMLGKPLADSLGVGVNQKVNLALINADGQVDEANFTIRGLFSTGILSYDESAIFIPLSKAQAFTGARERASAIIVLLHQRDEADTVAAAVQTPEVATFTWQNLNKLFLETVDTALSFYVILDGIVILIVAVIIANTLLMAVFERIREIGILAALGMRRWQIMQMFLIEAFILGLAGVGVGFALGSAGVAYLSQVGIPLGASAGAAGSNFPIGSTMYAHFVPDTFMWLSVWTLIIVLLTAIYPARFAARQEPVDALHSL